MKNFVPVSIMFILSISLLLTACGNSLQTAVANTEQPTASSSNSQPTGSIDACALLTKTDAEKILNNPVKDAEHPIQGAEAFIVTSCTYRVQSDKVNDKVALIVSVSANGSAQTAQVAFNEDKNSGKDLYGATAIDIPELGDAAIWTAGSGNYVSILKGDVYLTLRATNYRGETAAQPMMDLAKLILSRLP